MRRVVVSLIVLALAACDSRPTEEEVRAEFASYVAQRNACEESTDCVLAVAGCPLGCAAAVNAAHQAAVEAKARELIDEYEGGDRTCMYGCVAQTAECKAGRCELVPADVTGGK